MILLASGGMISLMGLVVGLVALVLIGVGIALGLVATALAAVLLGMGVISSSIFIGVRSGRAGSGIRAFLIQIGLLAGIPAGAVCAWLAKSFFEAYGDARGWTVLAYGALGGALAGVFVALMLDFISRRMSLWAGGHLHSLRDKQLSAANKRYKTDVVRDVN